MNGMESAAEIALIQIGYWDDTPKGDWIMPAYLFDPTWDPSERTRVASYLKGGARVREDLGYSHCRLSSEIPDSVMGNAENTDGTWIWPEGLAIYIDRFAVRLPEAFLQHIRASEYEAFCPTGDVESAHVDTTFWKEWCRAQKREAGWLRYSLLAIWRTRQIRSACLLYTSPSPRD